MLSLPQHAWCGACMGSSNDCNRCFALSAAEQPGSLARALDGSAAPQQNGVSLATPTAEAALARRIDSRAARHSFFSESVGQPVLNIASFDIGACQTRAPAFLNVIGG